MSTPLGRLDVMITPTSSAKSATMGCLGTGIRRIDPCGTPAIRSYGPSFDDTVTSAELNGFLMSIVLIIDFPLENLTYFIQKAGRFIGLGRLLTVISIA